MKKSLKILSVFLAVLTFFGILSAATPVFAANVNEYITDKEYTEKLLTEVVEIDTEEKAPIVKEVEEKRDEYQKVYLREDGTYTAVISKTPVHYEKDGEWVDIVNDLKTNGDVITNTAGNFNVEFPKEISEGNEIKIENGKETITFSIVETEKSNGKVKNNKKQKQDKNKVSDEEIFNNDISRTVSEIEYEDILENTNLEYVITPNGVKENIIVENKESLKKSYSFNITKGNLKAELDKENNLYFKNSKGEIVFAIPAPVMTDSNGTISYDIDVKVKNLKEETITLTYTPDKKWLNDKDRTYPVAIDPVIILDSDKEFVIEDTIVGYDTTDPETATQNGIDTFLAILLNNGTIRSDLLVKFNSNLVNTYKQPNIVVTDVNYLVNGGVINGNILVKPISGSWDASTITGEDVFVDEEETPIITYDDEVIDYYTGRPVDAGDGDVLYFNITNLFNEWLNGTHSNDGFALMLDNENAQALFSVSGYYTYKGSKKYYYSYCTIDYIDASGNNSNYEYLTQDVGRAGTFNVNTFTRGFTGYREDLSLQGSRMPVSVGFNYNSAFVNYLEWYKDLAAAWDEEYYAFYSPYGDKWSPNYMKALMVSDFSPQVYYFTETGTMAVFNIGEETTLDENNNDITYNIFEEDSSGETGYTLTLIDKKTDTDYTNLVLTTPSGEKEYFDENGYVVKIEETEPGLDGVCDEINITYEDYTTIEAELALPKIKCITDCLNRKYVFEYTEDKLTSITCKSNGDTQIYASDNVPLTVQYGINQIEGANTYAPTQLTSVTYQDGETISYSYVDKNSAEYEWDYVLTNAKNVNSYNIDYTYDSLYKVTDIEEYYNSTRDENYTSRGNYIELTQNSYTSVTIDDYFNGKETHIFSPCGELLYTLDDKGNYCKNSSTQENIVSDYSWKTSPENLLKNHSFETASTLSAGTAKYWGTSFNRIASNDAHTGSYVYEATTNGKTTISNEQSISVTGGKTYTFSAYVKSVVAGSLQLKISASDASGSTNSATTIVTSTNGWEQYSVTITMPNDITDITVGFGFVESENEAESQINDTEEITYYIDSVQLETGLGTSEYNHIENGSFNFNTDNWTTTTSTTNISSTINGETITALKLPKCLPTFDVVDEETATLNENTSSITQNVLINGKENDIYSIGAMFKGMFTDGLMSDSIKMNFGSEYTPPVVRSAQIKVDYNYTNTVGTTTTNGSDTFTVDLLYGVDDWQYVNESFALKGNTTNVNITIILKNIPIDILVTNVELTKNDNAAILDDSDDEENSTDNWECESCKNLNYSCNSNSISCSNCVECHSETDIETISSDNKTITQKSFDGTNYMQSSTTYSDDFNYIATETDENNISKHYTYNANGTLKSITDSKNSKVSYKNDPMGYISLAEMAVTGLSDNATKMTLEFAYDNDLLKTVKSGDVTYTYTYNNWGQISSVAVDNQILVRYYYGSGINRTRITKIVFGSSESTGFTIQYAYNSTTNDIVSVSKYRWVDGVKDTITYSYTYDNLGNLKSIQDNKTGHKTEYTDTGLRILKTVNNSSTEIYKIADVTPEDNSNTSTNNTNTPINITQETVNGIVYTHNVYDSKYDAQTGKTTETEAISGNSKTLGIQSVSDWFGRTTNATVMTKNPNDASNNSFSSITSDYSYITNSNVTTNLISSLNNSINNGDNTVNYSYTYDENGKITKIETTTSIDSLEDTVEYVYDEAGQLRREITGSGSYWEYTYDSNGNISGKKRYSNNSLVSTKTFTYGSSAWEDRLTGYGNKTITYDAIGNPTNYLGATLTWRGRELVTYSDSEKNISYSYDVDGMRYQKVVTPTNGNTEEYNYVYADGTLVLITYKTGNTAKTAKFIYDSFGEPRGVIYENKTYMYLKNAQGDITALIDENGNVILTYSYDAWGSLSMTLTSISTLISVATDLSKINPFTYRGYCYDYDIELYYLQSRYYDPETCRFINADNINELGKTETLLSYNLFTYCENDPVNWIDETGAAKYSITAIGIQIEMSATFLGCAGEVGIEFVFVPKTKKFYVYVYMGAGAGASYSKDAYNFFKKNLKFLVSKSNVSLKNIKNMFSFNVSFSIGLFLVRTTSDFSWPKGYTKGQSSSNSLSIGKGKAYISKASNGTYKCYGVCIATTGYGVSQSSVVNKQFSVFLKDLSSWLKKRQTEIINYIE